MNNAWRQFAGSDWKCRPDVSGFLSANLEPYCGGPEFLTHATTRTTKLWSMCEELMAKEKESGGVLGIDTAHASSITAYGPGYIDPELELIVGLQTSRPLERPVHCQGGIRMAEQACRAYGRELDPSVSRFFRGARRTHNDAVFSSYSAEMKKARRVGLLTGLPDSYGRGRIIGDYRRVPLYGTSALIEWKSQDMMALGLATSEDLQLRDELALQIDSLRCLEKLGDSYGVDVRLPACDSHEAVQLLYMAYLAALKEQNGAAMSLGRVSSFLDVYMSRDLAEGSMTEERCQELVDHFVIKLRMARMLRTPEYNTLFAGDPLWITESIGGMSHDGKPRVTRTSFRFLQTLRNLGPGPEPNMTILWSPSLPQAFKDFCSELSMETSSLQYENDELMRPMFGDDYGIACCVSAMSLGKDMQFFGARCNLPKLLLLALNGGRDEMGGDQIGPDSQPLGVSSHTLSYAEVWTSLMTVLDWFVPFYAQTMNLIHSMHDRYCYESLQMGLLDTQANRYMAFGIAGLSIVADSLSAIRYAQVRAVRDGRGLTASFSIDGTYPAFGNDDNRVDEIATQLVTEFNSRLSACTLYRNAIPTLSLLTITSNVVYGCTTGATPDGRPAREPFAPGANPVHSREVSGMLASLNSASKLPYEKARDGISYTVSIAPQAFGRASDSAKRILSGLLDGFFCKGGHHLNVNVVDRAVLEDAMENPERYPNLTLRVSGYAVHFTKLSHQQQEEVLKRTYFLKGIA